MFLKPILGAEPTKSVCVLCEIKHFNKFQNSRYVTHFPTVFERNETKIPRVVKQSYPFRPPGTSRLHYHSSHLQSRQLWDSNSNRGAVVNRGRYHPRRCLRKLHGPRRTSDRCKRAIWHRSNTCAVAEVPPRQVKIYLLQQGPSTDCLQEGTFPTRTLTHLPPLFSPSSKSPRDLSGGLRVRQFRASSYHLGGIWVVGEITIMNEGEFTGFREKGTASESENAKRKHE